MLLLAAVLFLNYVDRGALPTAAALIQRDLSLNFTQMGVLLSAFYWTYAAAQIPIGWIAERYGAQRVLAIGLALWALATMLVGLAYSYAALLGLRFLLGLGESVGFPCTCKLLAATVPAQALGTANGIVAFAYLFGPAAGTYFGGLVAAHYGWRAAFVLFGLVSLLWLLPWSRVSVQPRVTAATSTSAPTMAAILRQPALWATGIGHFSSNYAFYFMLSWLPSYLVRERGYSTVEMAQLAGAAFLVNALSAIATGWGIDRFVARGGSANLAYKAVAAIGQSGAVICMLVIAEGGRPLAIGGIFLYQMLGGAASPGVFAMAQILAGPGATGRWVGIQNTLGNIAGMVAPQLTGWIVDKTGHFALAFVVTAGVSVLGFIAYVFMLQKLAPLEWNGQRPGGVSAEPVQPG